MFCQKRWDFRTSMLSADRERQNIIGLLGWVKVDQQSDFDPRKRHPLASSPGIVRHREVELDLQVLRPSGVLAPEPIRKILPVLGNALRVKLVVLVVPKRGEND